MRRGLITLALALFAAPLTANAIPVQYQIEFTVLSGSVHTIALPASGPATSDAADAAGMKYFGLFAVDSDILATDGIAKPGDVDFFFIQMEDNIWGYNYPGNNSFVGFRGGQSPAFDVVNGAITNLHGGVFGYQDSPFVDFSLFGSNTFNARGNVPAPPLQPGTSFSFLEAVGTMDIARVPEPGTLGLCVLALGGLLLAYRLSPTARAAGTAAA